MRNLVSFLSFLFVFMTCSAVASAGVLKYPDIYSNSLFVDYNATGFFVEGAAWKLTTAKGNSKFIYGDSGRGGLFSLNAVVDNAGNLASGVLEIRGKVNGMTEVGTLLKAELTGLTSAFASNPTVESSFFFFDFRVLASQSLLANLYGSTGLVTLDAGVIGVDSFNHFFSSSNNTADTNPTVPEPSAAAIWATLLACGWGVCRRSGRTLDRLFAAGR